jgi:hypothetical protein
VPGRYRASEGLVATPGPFDSWQGHDARSQNLARGPRPEALRDYGMYWATAWRNAVSMAGLSSMRQSWW